jgi:hypothetical protein
VEASRVVDVTGKPDKMHKELNIFLLCANYGHAKNDGRVRGVH